MPAAAKHIDLVPHCSLSVRGALLFFGSVCFVTFGVAGAATALGYWPVLPFAGAEMLLLGWALKTNMARRFERESIAISCVLYPHIFGVSNERDPCCCRDDD